ITPWRPDRASLTRLAGRYRSDELEVDYELLLDGDHLALRVGRLPPAVLSPLTEDEFEAGDFSLRITRKSGRAAGFILHSWGVRAAAFPPPCGGVRSMPSRRFWGRFTPAPRPPAGSAAGDPPMPEPRAARTARGSRPVSGRSSGRIACESRPRRHTRPAAQF